MSQAHAKPVVQLLARLQKTGGVEGHRHRKFHGGVEGDRVAMGKWSEVAASADATHHVGPVVRGDGAW